MGNSEHASVVYINSLAVSMREQLMFYPLSQECCIYRVPEPKRCLNPSDYTPRLVSIGPLHHKIVGLQAMEEHKLRYLRHFLQRTQVSIEDFLALINRKEANLRNCYAETIKLESKDFVRTILVDAVFVLEFLLRGFRLDHFMSEDDRIFGKPRMYNEIVSDLWLVENQLPLFILNDLFNLAKSAMYADHYEGLNFFEISFWFLKTALNFVPMEETLFGIHFSGAEHFLDLLSLCLNQKTADFKAQNMHSAKELQQAGVKFEVVSIKIYLTSQSIRGFCKFHLLRYMITQSVSTQMF